MDAAQKLAQETPRGTDAPVRLVERQEYPPAAVSRCKSSLPAGAPQTSPSNIIVSRHAVTSMPSEPAKVARMPCPKAAAHDCVNPTTPPCAMPNVAVKKVVRVSLNRPAPRRSRGAAAQTSRHAR